MTPPDVGTFPLESVAALPNITVAFPGEHWSNRKASEPIVPGEAVIPINSGGRLYMRRAGSGDLSDPRLAVAKRVVEHPDGATGSTYTQPLGPNEIVNRRIEPGEYVHAYYSGAFHLTLVEPRAWEPSDLVAWDPAGARPAGKGGVGSWALAGDPAEALFEVLEFRKVNDDDEGILTVRSLRGQF